MRFDFYTVQQAPAPFLHGANALFFSNKMLDYSPEK